jgi:putative heme degradation protein
MPDMDAYDITQILLITTAGLVFARFGLALARRVEMRSPARGGLTPAAEDRLRALEEECAILRQELSEVHERQNFTERLLLESHAAPTLSPSDSPDGRVLTPR